MNKNKYTFMIGVVSTPAVRSQVLNWLLILQNQGIVFDLCVCLPLSRIIKGYSIERKVISEYRGKLRGSITVLPVLRTKTRGDVISSLIKAVYLVSVAIPCLHRDAQVFVQTRSLNNYQALTMVKRVFKNIKVVFDMRGTGLGENFDNINSLTPGSRNFTKERSHYQEVLRSELAMISFADVNLFVSNQLKMLMVSYLGSENEVGMHVLPGGADAEQFFYDEIIRQRQRKALDLVKKTVFIYSGSLSSFWHKSELIFAFAAAVLCEDPNSTFVCLTTHQSVALDLAKKEGIAEDRMICKQAETPQEINEFYNAADYAILFRDNLLTNQVSSPTKLAEYLMSGLPVIMSDNIGDYSSYIKDSGFGRITDNSLESLLAITKSRFYNDIDRRLVSIESAKRFSKQSNIEKAKEIYLYNA